MVELTMIKVVGEKRRGKNSLHEKLIGSKLPFNLNT